MEYAKHVFPFLFKEKSYPESHSIINRPLVPLKVERCNASGPWSFSDATIEISTEKSGCLPELFAYRGAIQTILRSGTGYHLLTRDQKVAFDLLGNYLQNENHLKCLQSLLKKPSKDRKDSEIQVALALHLFSPLVTKPDLVVDSTCDEKCPCCGTLVRKGDTSFGNSKVWHGHADIIIRKSKVKVAKHVPVHIDEESNGGPKPKRMRTDPQKSLCDDYDSDGSCTSVIEVKTILRDQYMPNGPFILLEGIQFKDLSEILAQTIVNSFIQNKKFPALKDHFIPCFLASEKHITIHMYNPLYDILITQGETMKLFSGDKFNNDTILTVWLALNFDIFPPGLLNEEVQETWQKYCTKQSGFKSFISSCIDVYNKKLDEPMVVQENDVVMQGFYINFAVNKYMKEFWESETRLLMSP